MKPFAAFSLWVLKAVGEPAEPNRNRSILEYIDIGGALHANHHQYPSKEAFSSTDELEQRIGIAESAPRTILSLRSPAL